MRILSSLMKATAPFFSNENGVTHDKNLEYLRLQKWSGNYGEGSIG